MQTPPGYVERAQALSASGEYGQWLRGRDVVATVNGVAFVHGGLTPEVAALGCEEINRKVRSELGTDLAQTRANPQAALATGENGPLSYRGLAREDETALLPSVEKVLQSMGVKAVVIAHTPTGDGKIRPRFGGRVVMVDVGMLAALGGHLAALEVGPDGSLTAIYPTGRDRAKAAGPRLATARAPAFGHGSAPARPADRPDRGHQPADGDAHDAAEEDLRHAQQPELRRSQAATGCRLPAMTIAAVIGACRHITGMRTT